MCLRKRQRNGATRTVSLPEDRGFSPIAQNRNGVRRPVSAPHQSIHGTNVTATNLRTGSMPRKKKMRTAGSTHAPPGQPTYCGLVYTRRVNHNNKPATDNRCGWWRKENFLHLLFRDRYHLEPAVVMATACRIQTNILRGALKMIFNSAV